MPPAPRAPLSVDVALTHGGNSTVFWLSLSQVAAARILQLAERDAVAWLGAYDSRCRT